MIRVYLIDGRITVDKSYRIFKIEQRASEKMEVLVEEMILSDTDHRDVVFYLY